MAFTSEDAEGYLLSQARTGELAEAARINVANRRIAEQAEEARAQAIGSGVEGSDSDLEPTNNVRRESETSVSQSVTDWMKETTKQFMDPMSHAESEWTLMLELSGSRA